ncbi:MAG: PqqD family protein [candidate division WOR-3 bacterium]
MKRKASLPWRKVDDEGIVLSDNKDEAHILNESALMIWEMLDGQSSSEMIARRLSREYEIPEKIALRDVKKFLKELRVRGLVE